MTYTHYKLKSSHVQHMLILSSDQDSDNYIRIFQVYNLFTSHSQNSSFNLINTKSKVHQKNPLFLIFTEKLESGTGPARVSSSHERNLKVRLLSQFELPYIQWRTFFVHWLNNSWRYEYVRKNLECLTQEFGPRTNSNIWESLHTINDSIIISMTSS